MSLRLPLAALVLASWPGRGLPQLDSFDRPPIHYRTAPVDDPVAE